jgi:hypothetical protein
MRKPILDEEMLAVKRDLPHSTKPKQKNHRNDRYNSKENGRRRSADLAGEPRNDPKEDNKYRGQHAAKDNSNTIVQTSCPGVSILSVLVLKGHISSRAISQPEGAKPAIQIDILICL